MAISVGDKLPDATFQFMGADGPEEISVADLCAGKTVALFGVPGAYTPTCHNTHMPSFVNTADALKAKGVDAIACVSVNDIFVMQSWGEATGATGAGIHLLSDGDAGFTKAMGLEFSAPPAALHDRSKRYSMLVKDGAVATLNVEDSPGEAVCSIGEALVDQI